jgi:hypothetical protein
MKRMISLLTVIAVIFLLSSCRVEKPDINRAEHFLSGVASLKSADPVDDLETLIGDSADILNLPVKSFDLHDWDEYGSKYKKYYYFFNSDGTFSLYFDFYGKLDRVAYTFTADSTEVIYNAAETLTDAYGQPVVTLDSVASTQKDVLAAIDAANDRDLRYCYEWLVDLDGSKVYIYLAYYYNSGTNFVYLVVSPPTKDFVSDITEWPLET